ncbi:MAG: hypothetical protein V7739_05715 [Motiliproteus sp.]
MKYFIPVTDEQLFNGSSEAIFSVSDDELFSDSDMKRYRLVPYNPDFIHIRSIHKQPCKLKQRNHSGRNRHDNR